DAQDHDQSAGAARDVLAGLHRMRRKQSALHPLHRDDAGALSAPRPVLALRHPTNRAKDRGTRQREFGSARADRPSGGRSDALTPTKPDVRFGSEADICAATSHVRFTPNSDRKSRHAANGHVCFHPKADMCSALAHVCFGPEADIGSPSITASASAINFAGIRSPSNFAVLRLMTNSVRVGRTTGSSAGSTPRSAFPTYRPTWR